MENENSTTVTRRDFLKMAWGTLGAVALAEMGIAAFTFSLPRLDEGEFGATFTCGAVDDFPPGSVTLFTQGRFYLVRLAGGGFLALYRVCTHLGCAVPWDPVEGQFVCPCHASAFDQTGAVLNPPAPRPLDLFPVTITDGTVTVDTARPVRRDHFLPEQAVYAEAS
ncbi:MAG: Rieske 2Fe-2S domain-containing protein [Anaerolineae bacterium]|nr:Rieske 2Fe-2S domain-containing protein [Anaerolineae bacterium]